MTTATMTAAPFTEELTRLLLRAVREVDEVAASREHPLAAEEAVRAAFGRAEWEAWRYARDLTQARYALLAGVLTVCEKASRYYAYSPASARDQLEKAADRLRPLAEDARAARDAAEDAAEDAEFGDGI